MKKLCLTLVFASLFFINFFSNAAFAAIGYESVSYIIDSATPADGYPDDSGYDLSNGVIASSNSFEDADWVGWESGDAIITFDTGSSQTISSVIISYMYNTTAGVSWPSAVEVSFSNNGTDFTTPISYTGFDTSSPVNTKTVNFSAVTAQYVKIHFIRNGSNCIYLSEVEFGNDIVPQAYVINTQTPASSIRPDESGSDLYNGTIATSDPNNSDWVEWIPSAYGQPYAIITFDTNSTHKFASMTISYLSSTAINIQGPNSVEVSFSDDGITFTSPINFSGFSESASSQVFSKLLNLNNRAGRFVKMKVNTALSSLLFLSEIKFNYTGNVCYTIDNTTPAYYYLDGTGNDLHNDVRAPYNYSDVDWVQFSPNAYTPVNPAYVIVTFDLGVNKLISAIDMTYGNTPEWSIHSPDSVEISVSNDGMTYGTPSVFTNLDRSSAGAFTSRFDMNATTARFVKFKINCYESNPDNSVFLNEFNFHYTGDITYEVDSNTPISDKTDDTGNDLYNGVRASYDYSLADWVNWSPTAYSPAKPAYAIITFDMAKQKKINTVELTYTNTPAWSICSPESVEISVSSDGVAFDTPRVFTNMDRSGDGVFTSRFNLNNVEGKYVRFKVNCYQNDASKAIWLSEFKFHYEGEIFYEIDNSTPTYSPNDETGKDLYNGFSASYDYSLSDWVGWSPSAWDPDKPAYALITFDFGGEKIVDAVDLIYTNTPDWGICSPQSVEISISNDGITFDTPRVFTNIDRSSNGVFTSRFDLDAISAKYVRFKVNCYNNNVAYAIWLSEFKFIFSDGVGYTIDSTTPPWPGHPDNPGNTLCNGIIAPDDLNHADWVEWAPDQMGTPQYVLINYDLGKSRRIGSVDISYHAGDSGWIDAPANVEISFSSDGTNFGTPITYSDFQKGWAVHTKHIELSADNVRYAKLKFNNSYPTTHGWMYLTEIKFNDKTPQMGDFDASGIVDLLDLSAFAGQWLHAGQIDQGNYVLEDFESYTSQEQFGNNWFEYFNWTGPSTCTLLTSSASSHSGSKALRWGYNVASKEGEYAWSEMQFVLPEVVDLSQYDVAHIWLNRDTGNSTELSLYFKFLNNGYELADIAGEKALSAAQGSTSLPADTWSEWQIDLHDLDYSYASGNGYSSLSDITNMTAILIGTIGTQGGTGFINVDDIILEKLPKCDSNFEADLNGDCKVNFADFSKFAANWMQSN